MKLIVFNILLPISWFLVIPNTYQKRCFPNDINTINIITLIIHHCKALVLAVLQRALFKSNEFSILNHQNSKVRYPLGSGSTPQELHTPPPPLCTRGAVSSRHQTRLAPRHLVIPPDDQVNAVIGGRPPGINITTFPLHLNAPWLEIEIDRYRRNL